MTTQLNSRTKRKESMMDWLAHRSCRFRRGFPSRISCPRRVAASLSREGTRASDLTPMQNKLPPRQKRDSPGLALVHSPEWLRSGSEKRPPPPPPLTVECDSRHDMIGGSRFWHFVSVARNRSLHFSVLSLAAIILTNFAT